MVNDKRKSRREVSNRLLDRKAIDNNLDKLINNPKLEEFEKGILRLKEMENREVLLCCLEKIKTVLASAEQLQLMKVANLLSIIAELYDGEQVVEQELMTLTQIPGLAKETKMLLLSFLFDLGIDEETITTLVDVKELTEMGEYAMQNLLSLVKGDLADQLFFLQEFGSFDAHEQEDVIRQLVAEQSGAAAEMLGTLAYAYSPRLSAAAIQALGHRGEANTLVLQELAAAKDQTIRAEAARELEKLPDSGLRNPRKWGWESPLGKIYDAVVTSIDGRGSRAVWLSWHEANRKNRFIGVNFLLNTGVGIKDCFGIAGLTKAELAEMVAKLSDQTSVIKGDFQYGLALIRNALAKSLAAGHPIPVEFAYWRRCLGEEIYPQIYEPSLNNLLPKSGNQVRLCFERSGDLFDHKEFAEWYQEVPEVYDIAEKVIEINRKLMNKPTHLKKLEKLEQKLIKELIKPVLPEIKERLLLTIDYLRKSGQAELAKDATVCLVTLNLLPVEQHPFIKRMCIESIKAAADNLSNGLDPRNDPDCFE